MLFFQAKVFLQSADQGNDISWVMSVVKRRRNVSGRTPGLSAGGACRRTAGRGRSNPPRFDPTAGTPWTFL